MKNDYEVRGNVTAIIIDSKRYGVLEVLISSSSFEIADKIPNYWCADYHESIDNFYVIGNIPSENGRYIKVKLHRFLTSAPAGLVVDHVNGNQLDNTDENLRVVESFQNSQNRKRHNTNSKSGFRGVHWSEKYKRWIAQIQVNRRTLALGSFINFEDAANARIEGARRHFPFSQEEFKVNVLHRDRPNHLA